MSIEDEKHFLSELFQTIKPNLSKNSAEFIIKLIDANEWGVISFRRVGTAHRLFCDCTNEI